MFGQQVHLKEVSANKPDINNPQKVKIGQKPPVLLNMESSISQEAAADAAARQKDETKV